MVALGATGLPLGPTLGVIGSLSAETVTPAAGTGTGEVDGKMVAVPSLDGCSVNGANELLVGATNPGGEVAATDDMGVAALVIGLDGAFWVVDSPTGALEGTTLGPSTEISAGKASVEVAPVAGVIKPVLGEPTGSDQWS